MNQKIVEYILNNLVTEKQRKAYKAVYIDKLDFRDAERKTGINSQSLRHTAERAVGAVNKHMRFARFVIDLMQKNENSQS